MEEPGPITWSREDDMAELQAARGVETCVFAAIIGGGNQGRHLKNPGYVSSP